MTTRGVLECRLTGSYLGNDNLYLESYVSLTSFFNSTYAQAVGIYRRACSYGAGGTGDGYPDETSHVGQNPWSVYEFSAATTPFWMLIQANSDGHCSSSTSGPTRFDGNTNIVGIAVSFAMRADGGTAWNGTLANNGSDMKGVSVWAGGPTDFYVWPRSNSWGGSYSAVRDNMLTLTETYTSPVFGMRVSAVCDENNVVFVTDLAADNRHKLLYFGKYTPRADMTDEVIHPYVCLRNGSHSNQSFDFGTYGSTGANANGNEGGIAHPHSALSGTKSATITSLSAFWTQYFQPSSVTNASGSFKFDEWPIHVGMNEFPDIGYLGTIDWLRYCWGPDSSQVSQDGSRAYFGNNLHNTTRASIPWSSVVYPTAGYDRSGRKF